MPRAPGYPISELLSAFPPRQCRLLARVRRGTSSLKARALSSSEIARASGLSSDQVDGLSHLKSWSGVPVDTMLAFSRACGVDFCDVNSIRKQADYLRQIKGPPPYLRESPQWPLLRGLVE